jgi:predicted negative regulator of RcsB-dependent stress response
MITWFFALIVRIGWRRLATWTCAGVALAAILAVLQDPFGWRKANTDRLEQRAASAEADARARSLETTAERESAAEVARVVASGTRTRAATEALMQSAAAAPDGAQPLDPARLARLRAHDAAICAEVRLAGCEGVKP